MGHFGEELRRERISRGVALETISGTTKIVTRYLTALENEQFDVLPGGILSKGIVRGYARAVGLDESTWVERFLAARTQQGLHEDDNGWATFASNVGHSRPRLGRSAMGKRWAGVLALLLVLAGFGWFVWHYVSGRVLASEESRHVVTSSATADASSDDSQ
ncbi:MAG TPA: helix-turn-helix domain-containing protein [Acidobacteriaceae bacterium]|nr:helix-turn-helix domain-containing protein [Acidobacteriaceae bacterium]